MDRVLEIIGILGLPAVIVTMLLARMGKKKRKREKDAQNSDDGNADLR